jgi:hypothetical protein
MNLAVRHFIESDFWALKNPEPLPAADSTLAPPVPVPLPEGAARSHSSSRRSCSLKRAFLLVCREAR